MLPFHLLSSLGALAHGWAETGNTPGMLVEGRMDSLWEGLGWSLSHMSGEVEESERARQGGLAVGMALFLGKVATKPFPQLLPSSNSSFPEC